MPAPTRRGGGRRRRAALLVTAALLTLPSAATANSGGITQHSGKQNQTCNACHSGGVAPTVRLIGPAEVAPGSTTTFRFEVESAIQSQTAAGFNVAVSDGTLAVIPGEGARRAGDGEITHTGPKENEDGVAGWSFTWKAPTALGRYRLFGAGNSVNENSQSFGDRARAERFNIDVVEGLPSATPSPSPPATAPPATATASATTSASPSQTPTASATAPAVATATASPSATATSEPSATASAVDTATASPPPTSTETPPGSTVTPTDTATASPTLSPTPSPTSGPAACAGDCDGDGAVQIGELVTGVNIALGRAAIAACAALDRDDSGSVDVSELVGAVNRALRGCV